MPLVSFNELIREARRKRYAVGYFEAWSQDSLEAVLEAAEETRSPVILGFGCSTVNQEWFDNTGFDYLSAMGKAAVERSKVPVCYILNEIQTYNQMERATGSGFNIVMMDTCELPYGKNLALMKKVVRHAHLRHIAVEGELGSLPTSGDKDKKGDLTDPDQAAEFVEKTGIDALSVSIGNVHVLTKGKARIDMERLADIYKAVDVPLVVHGGTGFPHELVPAAVKLGVLKFNVGTVMKKAYLEEIMKRLPELKDGRFDMQAVVGSRKKADIFMQAKDKVKETVKIFLKKYGSVGKA